MTANLVQRADALVALHRRCVAGAFSLLLPNAAWAEVCDKQRPLWDPAGGPATWFDEALHFAASPVALLLLLATAIAVRIRNQWAGLAAVSGWSILISVIVFGDKSDPTGVRQMAIQEGCIGSPSLFIGLVAAICVATIIYTAPSRERSSE